VVVTAAGRVSQGGRRSPAAAGVGALRAANSGRRRRACAGWPAAGCRAPAAAGGNAGGEGGGVAEAAPPARWLLTTAARPAARLPGRGRPAPRVGRHAGGGEARRGLRDGDAAAPEVGAGAQRGRAEQVDGGGGVEVDAGAHRHADVGGQAEAGREPTCADRLTSRLRSRLRPADSSKPALRSSPPPPPIRLEASRRGLAAGARAGLLDGLAALGGVGGAHLVAELLLGEGELTLERSGTPLGLK
jgi:hypothetical protein